ncbi:hypothetical protein EYZ11_007190 [Aspergillus tanneri]|uniref:Uncharacterized protein n=1 Tax=Aspergillus tanneri TaxID=1220188 RepID=A0A4V3UP18_9EURO|nr:hypothetical protein EYZ11_007190 [Aspergillus tanneri]
MPRRVSAQREISLNPACYAANYLSLHGLDDFSIAFRTFSTRLRELHLEGVRISSALFWPVAEEEVNNVKSIYWPNLEVLTVLEAPPYTADGKWILDYNPNKDWEGDLDKDSFEPWHYDREYYALRGLIKSHDVDRLYESMGLAVRRMLRLRKLRFSFRGEIGERGSHEYLEFRRDLTTGKAALKISTEWEYRMAEKVLSTWGLKGEKAKEFRERWSVLLD